MRFFSRKPKEPEVHVGDPRFDDWETVEDFEDLATATSFAGRLSELQIPNALTADWPLDRFGSGAIYLQVPGDFHGDATAALSGWEP